MSAKHTATPLTEVTAFADKNAVVVENAYIRYLGQQMDHGAAYAIAEAMAPICACNAYDDQVDACKEALEFIEHHTEGIVIDAKDSLRFALAKTGAA